MAGPKLSGFEARANVLNTFKGGNAVEAAYGEGTRLYRIGPTLQATGDINTDSLMTSQEQRRVGVQVAAHENYTAAENAVNKIFATLQAIGALATLTTIPIGPSANVVAEYSRVETRQSKRQDLTPLLHDPITSLNRD